MSDRSFLVEVTGDTYGEYRAKVISSPSGVMYEGASVADPLQITALRSKLAANPSEEATRALGTLLFETLFTGDARDMLSMALYSAPADSVLRLQLAIEPNELSALPWELLFDPVTEQFLALSPRTTLVRYLPMPQPARPLAVAEGPMRILALFPNPHDAPPIDIVRERALMEEALGPLIHSGFVEVTVLEHATVWAMVEALREQQVHLLYYQGHVGFNADTRASYFLLEDRAGEAFRKGMYELSYSLRTTRVPLAVINSCGMAAGPLAYELVRHGIPGAVATQEPLRDKETIAFLRDFSAALAVGRPLDAAVSYGRRAMAVMCGLNARWASPMLVVRQRDAALFSLEERR